MDHRQVTFAGTSKVYGEVNLADALDLDAAVTARAARLEQLAGTAGHSVVGRVENTGVLVTAEQIVLRDGWCVFPWYQAVTWLRLRPRRPPW